MTLNDAVESALTRERDEARAALREWETVLGPWWDATKASPSAPEQARAKLAESQARVEALEAALRDVIGMAACWAAMDVEGAPSAYAQQQVDRARAVLEGES